MFLTQYFAGSLKKVTDRKCFGSYYHSLICHAPLHLRIFCGQTINTGQEEATFNKLKTSRNLTSNHHHGHILTKATIRFQIQKELNDEDIQERESMIRKIYQDIKKSHQNTIISLDFIKKHPSQYHRLLEKQVDYLSEGWAW